MPDNSLASETFETYRLLSRIKATEYLALSDNKKESLRIMLSCGHIDLRKGSFCYNQLLSLFPEGTDTYDNIIQLLKYTAPPVP